MMARERRITGRGWEARVAFEALPGIGILL